MLEEAGSTYYYSTFGDSQDVQLVHGIRLTGGMDVPQMVACCREHGIRLLVDAAHPFAEELHRNLLFVARHIGSPIVRYDRIFPPRSDDLVWCKDYDDAIAQLEAHQVDRLLALTGVNTIGRLRHFWQQHECWFRILNRRFSHTLACKSGFPEDHLVYFEQDDTRSLLEQLRPQAMLTKESGLTGGFTEKTEAAREAGVQVFVIERPPYPPHTPNPQHVDIEYVDGPYGLRRTIERLLPDFYPLRSGLTTGTCATAAAIADARRQLLGETPREVPVTLPNGETIRVTVGYADGYAFCQKDAGNDPDVTNQAEVRATVERIGASGTPASEPDVEAIEILGGAGVGRFTLPGFDYPPGAPAINRVPRQMIRQNLHALLGTLQYRPARLRVTLSIADGESLARRTFNPRLGIEGGLSIIGVSGIVKPFSEEAFVNSIRKCMEVARASGTDRVVINSGGKSERFVRQLYPDLPSQAFVEYGNQIGATLRMAEELHFGSVTLGVMLGKAVKLAAGHLDTHSARAVMDKLFVGQMLREACCPSGTIEAFLSPDVTLARELWHLIPADCHQSFCHVVIGHCAHHCRPLVPGVELTILLITEEGDVWSAEEQLSTNTASAKQRSQNKT